MPRKAWIILSVILVLPVLYVAGTIVAGRAGWMQISYDDLKARYLRPDSRFITIDGVPIHYVDAGSGPAIVLLHGSYGSLRMWDGWAAALTPRHRVVRLDLPPFGLTGPDPKGVYSYPRVQQLLEGFTMSLGLTRFDLAGTSSGGVIAFRYAAYHPEQVSHLILTNFPIAHERIEFPTGYRLARIWGDDILRNYRPRIYTSEMLHSNFVDQSKVTDALIDEWTDMANRTGAVAAMRGYNSGTAAISATQRAAELGQITVPTLVIWSDHDPELSVQQGHDAFALLKTPVKSFEMVEHAGHMLPIERPEETVKLVEHFIGDD